MRFIYIILFYTTSIFALSQEMIIDWDECFGSTGIGSVSYAVESKSNSEIISAVLVSGFNEAFSNYHGGTDSWVLILDQHGNIQKERCFGGSENDYIYDIEVYDDNIYLIGQTYSTDGDVISQPVGGYGNIWVIKTDFNLNIIWEKQFGSLGTNRLETAKITTDGGLIILMDFFNAGGGDVSSYYGGTDIWICEINNNGVILWEKTLGNTFQNRASNILRKANGNIVVIGFTNGIGGILEGNYHGDYDIWICELDGINQNIIWQNCYGGSSIEAPSYIAEENLGYFVVGTTKSMDGDIESYFHGFYDAWAFIIDDEGQIIWEKCFGGSGIDTFKNVYKIGESGHFLLGATNSENGDVINNHCPYSLCYTNTWVVELDGNKNIVWNSVFGPIGYDSWHEKNAIKRIGDHDFIISGIVKDSDINTGDVHCEPYPVNNGSSAWLYRLYDPDVGIKELTSSLRLQAYPNPAKSQITFKIPRTSYKSSLIIKDILGNIITELPIYSGQTDIHWNCNQLEKGVYLYQTEIDEKKYRGKFIIN